MDCDCSCGSCPCLWMLLGDGVNAGEHVMNTLEWPPLATLDLRPRGDPGSR
jgi:hypothetical protein